MGIRQRQQGMARVMRRCQSDPCMGQCLWDGLAKDHDIIECAAAEGAVAAPAMTKDTTTAKAPFAQHGTARPMGQPRSAAKAPTRAAVAANDI